MQIVECRHCLHKVAVASDGRCPGCGENARQGGVGDERTGMTISAKDNLPSVCHRCGESTASVTNVQRRAMSKTNLREAKERIDGDKKIVRRGGNSDAGALILLPILVFRWIFFALTGGTKVKIRLPHCRPCQALSDPQPLSVSFEQRTMRFAVHPRFKSAAR